MMKPMRITLVAFLFIPLFGMGQALNVPSFQTFYGGNPDHHLVGFSKRYSSGLGFTGLATISAIDPSSYSDKFFIGPSYTFSDNQNSRWSASIAPGIWTTGALYNFPIYPLNYGFVSQVDYMLTEDYSVRLGLNFNREDNFSTGVVGFTYHLGETFFPTKLDSNLRKINLAFTYGGNVNGHVFLLETKLSNKLGFHAITLSDALHPSTSVRDSYYIGPAFFLEEEFLGPFDLSMSLGIYTYGLVYNFPAYPILPGSNIKLDYNWKERVAISTGLMALPMDAKSYSYLGICYSI